MQTHRRPKSCTTHRSLFRRRREGLLISSRLNDVSPPCLKPIRPLALRMQCGLGSVSYRRRLVRPRGRLRSSPVSGSVSRPPPPVLCPLAPFPPSSDILPAASGRCHSLLLAVCPPFFLPQLTPSSTFMSSFKCHVSWELPLALGLGRGMTLLCSLELPVSILGSPLRCELSGREMKALNVFMLVHTHTRIHRRIYTHSICMCVI